MFQNFWKNCWNHIKEQLLSEKKYDFELNKNSEGKENKNTENKKRPVISALVAMMSRKKPVVKWGITKIYRKQFDVAKEKNLPKQIK